MTRRKSDPLRPLTEEECEYLGRIGRSGAEPAAHVARAKALLAVAGGQDYTSAARAAGRKSGDAVSHLVSRFNREGIAALESRHGGGPTPTYDATGRERILAEVRRTPNREADGTATWSLTTLQQALRRAPDGLPGISRDTIWWVLRDAGFGWQKARSWCDTGVVVRRRKGGSVEVTDPDAAPKNLIERAYRDGEASGLAVWTEDEAGPYQAAPYPGGSRRPRGEPTRSPHEYVRGGTAKLLTLLHPSDGEVRARGVMSSANCVLHPWLKEELTAILATVPEPETALSPQENRKHWESRQEGLSVKVTLPAELPPLRMLLILDNLAGHKTPALVVWLFGHGVMPLYTPLGGSWLNMVESVQRILARRALEGEHPKDAEQVIGWLEATVRGWNREPTPFEWGGRRKARRERAYGRRHTLGGSGAYTRRPIRRRKTAVEKWQAA